MKKLDFNTVLDAIGTLSVTAAVIAFVYFIIKIVPYIPVLVEKS